MKSLPAHRPTFDDPIYSQRNPHQTFLLAFSFLASVPVIVGAESGSAALNAELSPSGTYAWAWCLFLASALALAGTFWRGRTWTALVIERAGLLMLCFGAATYVTVLLHSTEDNGSVLYVVAVTSAYSCSCLWRAVQITRRLNWMRFFIEEINEQV